MWTNATFLVELAKLVLVFLVATAADLGLLVALARGAATDPLGLLFGDAERLVFGEPLSAEEGLPVGAAEGLLLGPTEELALREAEACVMPALGGEASKSKPSK